MMYREQNKEEQKQDGTTGACSLGFCGSCSVCRLEPQGAHYQPHSLSSLMCCGPFDTQVRQLVLFGLWSWD